MSTLVVLRFVFLLVLFVASFVCCVVCLAEWDKTKSTYKAAAAFLCFVSAAFALGKMLS